jgi:hypothetical protein
VISPNIFVQKDHQIMRNRRALVPGALDALESRLVLSHIGPRHPLPSASAHVAVAVPLPPTPVHHLALNGFISGTFTTVPSPVATGPAKVTILKGSGMVSPLGPVALNGSIAVPSPQAVTSPAVESVTLAGAQGSVTLRLTPMAAGTNSSPASLFQFTIIGSTGTFAGDSGTGTAALTLMPQGKFSLSLTSATPLP